MEAMAIGAASHQGGIAEFLDLSVVALVVRLGGDRKDLVSVHHLLVAMALLTNLGMKLLPKFDHFWLVAF